MTFTVELVDGIEPGEEVSSIEIHIDKQNLKSLISRLATLSDDDIGEHIHLMSSSWGLGDLTEEPHSAGNRIAHHLKIILAE